MGNNIVAAIRTGCAVLAVALLAWLGHALGVTLPKGFNDQVAGVLFILAVTVYNYVVNWLAVHVNPLFGVLLGIPKAPVYAELTPSAPAADGTYTVTNVPQTPGTTGANTGATPSK